MNHKIEESSFKASAVALSAAFIFTIILLSISSDNPFQAISFFFTGPFQNMYNFGNMLNEAGLLILAGLGMSIAFRAGVFNLGGEGQVYAGAIATVLVAINIKTGGSIGIISSIVAGVLTGALIAGISGFLKKHWNTNELISSFLFAGVVIHFTDYIISGPFRDSNSFLVSTVKIPSSFFLNQLFETSYFNISFFIALLATVVAFIFLFKTPVGYEIRLSGLNRKFATYGGISSKRNLILPMVISGAMYGGVGSFATLGNFHIGIKNFTEGMGWNGIAVALIAGNNPAYIIPAGIIFAYLDAGAQVAMIHSDLSFEFNNLIKAVIFFLITVKKFNMKKEYSID